jgi:hypothetical protein
VWTLLEYAPFFAGAWISGWNFYVSFLRMPFARWRRREVRYESGAPLVGSLILVWFAAWHRAEPGWFWASLAIAVLDTGGLHWVLGSVLWIEVIRPRWRGK